MRTLRARTILLLLTLAVLATPAFAGYSFAPWWGEVHVSAISADGSFGATRRSQDAVKRFYCTFSANIAGSVTTKFADCYAYDGVSSFACTTSNPGLIEAIRSAQPEDRVYLFGTGGLCSTVKVTHDSAYQPGAQP